MFFSWFPSTFQSICWQLSLSLLFGHASGLWVCHWVSGVISKAHICVFLWNVSSTTPWSSMVCGLHWCCSALTDPPPSFYSCFPPPILLLSCLFLSSALFPDQRIVCFQGEWSRVCFWKTPYSPDGYGTLHTEVDIVRCTVCETFSVLPMGITKYFPHCCIKMALQSLISPVGPALAVWVTAGRQSTRGLYTSRRSTRLWSDPPRGARGDELCLLGVGIK